MKKVILFLSFAVLAGAFGTLNAQDEKGAVDYNNEGVKAYQEKDYTTAYDAFTKAIELYKKEGDVDISLVYNTAYCAFKSKKYDEALPLFEEAKAKDYKESKPHTFIAQIYMKKKDYAKMEEALVEGLGKYGEDKTLKKLAGVCYQRQGLVFYNKGNKIKKAANDSGMNESDPDAFNAEYEKANEEFEKALPLFEKSYSYNAKSKSTLKALQNSYSSLKMDDKAAKIKAELEAL